MKIKIKSTMPIYDGTISEEPLSVEVNDWHEIELETDGTLTLETIEGIAEIVDNGKISLS